MKNKKDPMEIERKFLLKRLPPGLRKRRPVRIRQGYLIQSEAREARVRCKGRKWTLTVKDGAGLQRREVELAITAVQGRTLWPLTEGRRIEKQRYIYPWKGHRLEVDIFEGGLAPLRLCEIEFNSVAEAEDFAPPGFLGREVTEAQEYRNVNLALHGLPGEEEVGVSLGAMPFLMKRGKLYVVLVTNRSGNRWIFPKGQPEEDMTRPDVALLEAFEEAGVVGQLVPGVRAQCHLGRDQVLHLYPMKVTTLLKKWPESSLRKRQVVKFEKALELLNHEELAACAGRLEQRILGKG